MCFFKEIFVSDKMHLYAYLKENRCCSALLTIKHVKAYIKAVYDNFYCWRGYVLAGDVGQECDFLSA